MAAVAKGPAAAAAPLMGPPLHPAIPVKAKAAVPLMAPGHGPPVGLPKPAGPAKPKGPPPAVPIWAGGVGDLIGEIHLETNRRTGRPTGGPVMRAKAAGYAFGDGSQGRLARDAATLREVNRREHPRTHAQLVHELEYRDFQISDGAAAMRAMQHEENRAELEELQEQLRLLRADRDRFRHEQIELDRRLAEVNREARDEEAAAEAAVAARGRNNPFREAFDAD